MIGEVVTAAAQAVGPRLRTIQLSRPGQHRKTCRRRNSDVSRR